ncbi:MAG: hypothetical protein U9R51_04015 [Actinomycetota bacterium]|nr:hypothetical protein [Actinomycetota bacterium]
MAIVRDHETEDLVDGVSRRYTAASDHEPRAYVTKAAAGASITGMREQTPNI